MMIEYDCVISAYMSNCPEGYVSRGNPTSLSERRYFSGIPKAVQDVQRSGTAPCTRIGQDLLEVC